MHFTCILPKVQDNILLFLFGRRNLKTVLCLLQEKNEKTRHFSVILGKTFRTAVSTIGNRAYRYNPMYLHCRSANKEDKQLRMLRPRCALDNASLY